MKQGFLIVSLLAAAALPAGAAASEPSVSVGLAPDLRGAGASALALDVTGSTEADEISVVLDGTQTQFAITSTHPINPPPAPCTQVSTFQIHCPTSAFVSFSATLGAGNDKFTVGPSVKVPVTGTGGTGNDRLQGGSGDDTIAGGVGNDRLHGGNGSDTVRGGQGRDREDGGKGNDTLTGDQSHDVLNGGAGRDLIRGGPGHDTIHGGPGRDVEKQ
jgi:Ca2+-binding RTX toxin-like protein